nr:cytochrome P460 family protein [Bacteroidia bacterium]
AMNNSLKLMLMLLPAVTTMIACKKDKEESSADQAFSSEIRNGSYSYYQNGNTLSAASPSPHGSFKLKFNSTALAALDSTGELPSGATFPNGSVIVKEVVSGSGVTLLAVMKKEPSNANAGSGWMWAEYEPDGSTVFSVGKKGDGCIGCHSGSPNRDLVRSFDLH